MTSELMTEFSGLAIVILFAIYTLNCFISLIPNREHNSIKRVYHTQNILIYGMIILANLAMYMSSNDTRYLILTTVEIMFVSLTLIIYQQVYKTVSLCMLNNFCMLISISFIILSRLDIDRAIRQFILAFVCLGLSSIVPFIMQKSDRLRNLKWILAALGMLSLVAVVLFAQTEYGAKLSLNIGPVSVQPSEFVKLIFVMFVAAMLYNNRSFLNVLITTVVAVAFVLLLVASKDLGSAVIFVITYVFMLFVATFNWFYLILGFSACGMACIVAYKLFTHVQTRVSAWRDPLADPQNKGYQMCQSLFAIASGSWKGTGLLQGMPNKIPVVTKDFIFSAISEELGGIFAILLILVCMSMFLMIFSFSLKVKDGFYKLIVIGLGCIYTVQLFLSLGGTTKFIPSTGVTLPFISYGGSSMFMMMLLFGIVQGVFIIEAQKEQEVIRIRRQKRRSNSVSRRRRYEE